MKGDRIAFIQNGVTTRAEVVETLGPPLYEFESERTIGYAWETEGVSWGYTVLGAYHETYRKHDGWLFFVRFDAGNKVDRHGEARQLETESSRETVLRWLEKTSE